ncbi:hypothetical protein N7499_006243 [Penicillium canescens]|uniref:Uncharacterized protein n=1 Tax=Penicillium canescens TaxID=5083 RepID=A0AAD6N9E7_PENCN|nr:uncharacterized protein N7446_002022 [Penicillium canescens]KAJ6043824.1 hypothetical protein N7460_005179 [Penicillium canescens]KAJ6055298.1 hypothetical protein N7444_004396 [Penicillium canescens]KAJ6074245.1 hypothetical protein N7446_002022 [Penicillium canescens]KAJ6081369.1 hypothetical protein N7499_006243 [Penicillium canescens]KAJ6176834.1 hypothetical protein N7485_003748 [Penicillium canescens]
MPTETKSRRRRWIHTGGPITNITDVPEGWSSCEPDLHKDDVDGQIACCRERIRDAIMPDIFRHRLAHFLQRRSQMIASERSGLPWPVVQRLSFLKATKYLLELNGDHDEQMPNINGLMEAYQSDKKFEKGAISYWYQGAQIYPEKDGDKLDYWQATHLQSRFTGASSFWVEGLDVPWSAEVSLH